MEPDLTISGAIQRPSTGHALFIDAELQMNHSSRMKDLRGRSLQLQERDPRIDTLKEWIVECSDMRV
jgi:hypothetical protein